jgi:hypothetical protein
MNQFAFKHSARNLPLNGSMKALSVGLPGSREVERDTGLISRDCSPSLTTLLAFSRTFQSGCDACP